MKHKETIEKLLILLLFIAIFIPFTSAITGSIGNARMILKADVGDTLERYILVKNINSVPVNIILTTSGNLSEDIIIKDSGFILQPGETKKAYFILNVTKEGKTEGKINIEFDPLDGTPKVHLSSTIIVITDENTEEGLKIEITNVTINGRILEEGIVLYAGETAKVDIWFTAYTDEEVEVYADIETDIYENQDSTGKFDVVNGTNYKKSLSIKVPYGLSQEIEGDFSIEVSSNSEGKGKGSEIRIISKQQEYCPFGRTDDLFVSLNKLYVKSRTGSDGTWHPGDQIGVEVEVENLQDKNLTDMILEWCLYDVKNKRCDIKIEAEYFYLGPLEQKDLNYSFFIDPGELDDYNGDYIFYIRAYRDQDNYSCNRDSEPVNITFMPPRVRITAMLDPSTPHPTAGEKVIIKATLENIGDTETNYSISVHENEGWSKLDSINPISLTLKPGEFGTSNITLNINEDALGEKEFFIRALYPNYTTDQWISINIKGNEDKAKELLILSNIREYEYSDGMRILEKDRLKLKL